MRPSLSEARYVLDYLRGGCYNLSMKKLLPYLKYPLLFLGLAFIALGVVRQEYLVVLQKAVMICLECIGIG